MYIKIFSSEKYKKDDRYKGVFDKMVITSTGNLLIELGLVISIGRYKGNGVSDIGFPLRRNKKRICFGTTDFPIYLILEYPYDT